MNIVKSGFHDFNNLDLLQGSSFKRRLAQNFAKTAKNYANEALVQKHAAKNLVDQIFKIRKIEQSDNVLDIGAGSGFIAEFINQKQGEGNKCFVPKIFEIDIALEALKSQKLHIKKHKIAADFSKLPFAKKSFDLITSSFCIQWSVNDVDEDCRNFFQNVFPILKNHGLLAISVPCSGSFTNLKMIDKIRFLKLPDHQNLLFEGRNAGFDLQRSIQEEFHQKFDDVISALRWFKRIGAGLNNLSGGVKIDSSKSLQSQENCEQKNSLLSINRQNFLQKINKKSVNFSIAPTNHFRDDSVFFLDWKISYLIFQKT